MSIFKSLTVKTLAVARALSLAPATMPAGMQLPGVGISQAKADPYWRGGRHYRHGGYRGHRGYRGYRGYRHHRRNDAAAAAIIGGIVGLGVGAAIASQPRYNRYEPRPLYRVRPARQHYVAPAYGAPPRGSGAWYRYCAAKYRSFDARSGTYQPYHGPRRVCR
ncbi:MAG: BA14K family protein [Pseudomonadota bacterium]|nr:BA14K family protein [Pseudomonadota bacterium]